MKAGASRPSSFMSDHSVVNGLLLGLVRVAALGLGGSSGAAVTRSVPAGFQPLSFTAVSERDFWLLGTVPCGHRSCSAIVRTTDGGSSFAAIDAPAVQTSGNTPELRFADRRNGFLFMRWGGLFFATHNGGSSWKRLALGRILGFATGAGNAYVVTSDRLLRSRVSVDSWRSGPLPFPSDGSTLDLAAHQANLWLLGTRRSRNPTIDELAHSQDGGQTFR